jgi:SAM-dependent methyltransferase
MLVHIDDIFRNSAAPWFRARTWHEYASIRQVVAPHVDLETATILDFGCGNLPVAAASVALRHPRALVHGTDITHIDRDRLQGVLKQEAGLDVPDNLRLHTVPPNCLPEHLREVDLIYSWSVFEHIPAADITRNFSLIRERLAPDGLFLFQNGGLYFHTDGSHLKHLFPDQPWHHLLHSIAELREMVMASPRPEASKRGSWRQFIELNRLTADDFMDAASDAGLVLMWQERQREGDPPARLLRSYSAEALTTAAIRALFRRN